VKATVKEMDNYIAKNAGLALPGRSTGAKLPENQNTIQTELCRKTVSDEVTEEYSLPDYQPEIRRLLRVTANPMPPTQFLSSDNAEFSGTVDFGVLYSDNEGKLCMATLTGEYSMTAPLRDTADSYGTDLSDILCFADVVTDSVSARVLAPRKLGIRCRLRAKVSAYGTERNECTFGGSAPESSVERLDGTLGVCRVFRGESDRIMLGDEITSDSNPGATLSGGGELRIIMPEACVFVSEATPADGYVSCRGDVMVKVLMCRENPDSEPYTVTRKLPFAVQVEIDGATADSECRAFGKVTELLVSNEDGRILCEVGVVITAEAQKNVPMSYIKDIYSTDYTCETEMTDRSYPVAVCCMMGNVTSSGAVALTDIGVEPGSVVLDCAGVPSACRVTFENGKFVLDGECKYTALLSAGAEMFQKEFSLPFRYEFRHDGEAADGSAADSTAGASVNSPATDGYDADSSAEIVSVRCRIDAEKLSVDSELALSARISGRQSIHSVSAVMFGVPVSRTDGEIVICYPDKSDSLWSVCKRYGVGIGSVAGRNGIKSLDNLDAPASVSAVKYLLLS